MRWVDIVKMVASTSKDYKQNGTEKVLQGMMEYDNIPRKRKKFSNFVKNSLNVHSSEVLDEVWGLLETAWKKNKEEMDALKNKIKDKKEKCTAEETANGETDKNEKKASKKRRRTESEKKELESVKKPKNNDKPAKWKKNVRKMLQKKGSVTIKELQEIEEVKVKTLLVFLSKYDPKFKVKLGKHLCEIAIVSKKGTESSKGQGKKGWKKHIRAILKSKKTLTLPQLEDSLCKAGFNDISKGKILLFLSSLNSRLELNMKGKECFVEF